MTFEEKLRAKINQYPFGSEERNLLKVVLGEYQTKSATKDISEQEGLKIIEDMVKANCQTLDHLSNFDERAKILQDENVLLESMLPIYLTEQEIEETLAVLDIDVVGTKNEGQAIGMAMKVLKADNACVKGEDVKAVVQVLRKAAEVVGNGSGG